jgi:hypothetical protein
MSDSGFNFQRRSPTSTDIEKAEVRDFGLRVQFSSQNYVKFELQRSQFPQRTLGDGWVAGWELGEGAVNRLIA